VNLPSLWPKGVKEILECLEKGSKRFNQLAAVRVGSSQINRRTLANRLLILEEEELIKRTITNARPPLVVYTLTERGRRTLEIFRE
jgi:DNA-binding HxlR family transcriptional regulator